MVIQAHIDVFFVNGIGRLLFVYVYVFIYLRGLNTLQSAENVAYIVYFRGRNYWRAGNPKLLPGPRVLIVRFNKDRKSRL
jgi:hypothetical protein